MSLHKLGAGDGYTYLTNQVAREDLDRTAGESLSDYYAAGNRPGQWFGRGAEALGVSGTVDEGQMANLFGAGVHPVTGEALGQRFAVYGETVASRVDERLAVEPGASERRREVIMVEEERRRVRQAVAGFDCTFSPVKSVSVLWAIADDPTRATIEAAHRAAWQDTIGWLEDDVARTRVGRNGVRHADVDGLVVAAFDHRDTRTGDPQLHTHVVISNKVRTSIDGQWRALDGVTLHAAGVAASEKYNSLLEAHFRDRLGVEFSERPGAERRPVRELAGVPSELIAAFSQRRAAIEVHYSVLLAGYRADHGHEPPRAVEYKLAQQATLDTRTVKGDLRTASAERDEWRAMAATVTRSTADGLAAAVTGPHVGRAAPVAEGDLDGWAEAVLGVLEGERATWNRRHVQAEAERATRAAPVPAGQRQGLVDEVVLRVEQHPRSVALTPDDAVLPDVLRLRNGDSVYRPTATHRWTSTRILDAEAALDAAHQKLDAPAVADEHVARAVIAADRAGAALGRDQTKAVWQLAGSTRRVDVLIGPAGAGKTRTLATLVDAWTAQGGDVVGFVPSAAAAAVLAGELPGVACDNTAKWVHERRVGGDFGRFHAGQLVLVDEAGMTDTLTLAAVTAAAQQADAKVVLVGDPMQLGAIGGGGALRRLATTGHPATLTDLWRYREPWEGLATLSVRDGDASILDLYESHGRIHSGSRDALLDQMYQAWSTDRTHGRTSIMTATRRQDVTALSARARTDLVATGTVEPNGTRLVDGTVAGRGDTIVTRHNNRKLATNQGRDWVRNGDLWHVQERHHDGSLTVTNTTHRGTVVLPAGYVAEYVQLGYATTIHRAQGSTVDTSHTLIDPDGTRETTYVAMTRGRAANHAWVVTDELLDIEPERPPTTQGDAHQVLAAVLGRQSNEHAATDIAESERGAGQDGGTLLGRYLDVLSQLAPPSDQLLRQALDQPTAEAVLADPAWPASNNASTTSPSTATRPPGCWSRH